MLVIDFIINHWSMLLGCTLLGSCVGILTGFFGAGGGFIVTPALNIFLGLEMNFAVGTSACQVLGTSAFSLYHSVDRRLMGSRIALFMALGIPAGTYSGFYIVQTLKDKAAWHILGRTVDPVNFILLSVFAVFLIAIACWLIYDNFILRKESGDDESSHVGLFFHLKLFPVIKFRTIPAGEFSATVLILLGVFIGFMSGLLGIGGGVILLPALFYLVGQSTKYAALTGTMLVFVSSGFATVFHAAGHNINYPMA
ncbi:MAG: TSUP family transporter, partial [Victivallaceae bacterium]